MDVLPDSSDDEPVVPDEPGELVLPDVPEDPLVDALPPEDPDREPPRPRVEIKGVNGVQQATFLPVQLDAARCARSGTAVALRESSRAIRETPDRSNSGERCSGREVEIQNHEEQTNGKPE